MNVAAGVGCVSARIAERAGRQTESGWALGSAAPACHAAPLVSPVPVGVVCRWGGGQDGPGWPPGLCSLGVSHTVSFAPEAEVRPQHILFNSTETQIKCFLHENKS